VVDDWLIEEALGSGGESFIRKFIDGLQREDVKDAAALIKVLRIRGNEMREPQSKALGDGLFELRGRQVPDLLRLQAGPKNSLARWFH
jgi:hypothetical protein